ncbi:MAG: chemotaxis protein CheB [Cyanobacteria bacterium P01_D01_bin.1]
MPQDTQTETSSEDFPVIGIGASAGGLRALEDFFDSMPENSGAAFVVVQHLSPDFKSLMQELLGKHTHMVVEQVADGVELSPNTVFLIPPGQSLVLAGNTLHLTAREIYSGAPLHFPIDLFLHSLGTERKDQAIGIILSGTGSDGSQGIKTIAEQGGIVMVQDPQVAEFDGMPLSAIATGLPDLVLPADELARLAYQIITSPEQRSAIQRNLLNPTQLERIVQLLKRRENIDFAQYKTSTLSRQINRRCIVSGNLSLEEYIQKLEHSEEERQILRNDLLITVTHFFRDHKAWQYLKAKVLPGIVAKASADKPIRIWVTACATGEEAYSVAILLRELMTAQMTIEQCNNLEVKIFATDIDPIALRKASQGVYTSDAMQNLTAEQIDRFFVPKEQGFEVTRAIREMVIFANHNLAKDAGFTQIDLVSCRNVLIYMQPNLQQQVLRNLHFSLKQHGTLFLGESENLGPLGEEFKALQRKWKIYQKIRNARLPPFHQTHTYTKATANKKTLQTLLPSSKQSTFDPLLETAFKTLLQDRSATCLLINRDSQLLHVCCDALSLLRIPPGRASQEVFRMLPASLQLPISTALHRAQKKDRKVRYGDCQINEAGYSTGRVSIEVSKQNCKTVGNFFMVMIEAISTPEVSELSNSFAADVETAQYILQLQQELQANRENLQATVEELEVINEEQQATNEELTASNEELQSTNEELYSVNEELYTVNAEYQLKIQELTELNNDLDNLIDNIDIGVVYLDGLMRIRKFTPTATLTFNLVESDIGRPLSHLSHNLEDFDITRTLALVHRRAQHMEFEVKIKDRGPYLLMQVFPYANENKDFDGMILTLVNINDIKISQKQLAAAKERLGGVNEALEQQVRDRTVELEKSQQLLHSITQATPNGIYVYDLIEKRNIYANSFLERLLGYSAQQLQDFGSNITHHLLHPKDEQILIDYHNHIASSSVDDHHIFEVEYRIRHADGSWRDFYSQDTIFTRSADGQPTQILGTAIDASDRKAASRKLQASEARFRQLYQNTPAMMHSIDLEGNLLTASDQWLKRLGYRAEEVLGKPIATVLADRFKPDPANHKTPTWMSAAGCEHFECQFICKSGELIDVHLSAVADKDADGNVQRLLTVLIDVTEHKRTELEIKHYREHLEELVASRANELKETNKRLKAEVGERVQAQNELDHRARSLERSNADLEQFAYVVSHDLQEPLRAMTVFSQLLQQRYDKALDVTGSSYIKNIVEGGIRMQALIDGILDFSRLTHHGQLFQPVDIGPLVDRVLANLDTTLSENNATVTVEALPVVAADENQISQLFQNLIVNAIKFQHTAPPAIHINAQPSTEVPNCWVFSVSDNGIGISEDQQERIFSLFQRLHTRQELEGYGIGLAICKKIVERHNGAIWVESTIEKGSTFFFTLNVESLLLET